MAKEMETFVLVEMRQITAQDGSTVDAIRSILRTYENNDRAQEDLALMNQILPDLPFRVLQVDHFDR